MGKRDVVEIEGVSITAQSSSRLLKAACKCLDISQSGSKTKLCARLSQKVDAIRLTATKNISEQVKAEAEGELVQQLKMSPPEDPNDVLKRNITHLPYADWCLSCIRPKGRPGYRKSTECRKRGEPSVSFDLCYTSRAPDLNAKLTVVAAACSQTGGVCAIPLLERPTSSTWGRSWSVLGHAQISLRCDQEPTMLKVQELAQKSLVEMKCKVKIDNAKIGDRASNGLCEGAVRRSREMGVALQRAAGEKMCARGHPCPKRAPHFHAAFLPGAPGWIDCL